MKTPISYYGGKQNLAAMILKMIPRHTLYCEPFVGGAAVFFAKEKSPVEVINDTNRELINFYSVVQNDFVSLEKEVRITLHSRDLFRKASVIYNNPDMFSEIKRAWAVWTLATQGFASMIDASWGYDIQKGTTSKKVHNKREGFTEMLAIRLQLVQIECTDAIRIITSRAWMIPSFTVIPHIIIRIWDTMMDIQSMITAICCRSSPRSKENFCSAPILRRSYPSLLLGMDGFRRKWICR